MNTNTDNQLREPIEIAWQQLKDAVSKDDWPATQQAFRNMAPLKELEQQALILQQRIEQARSRQQINPVQSQPVPALPRNEVSPGLNRVTNINGGRRSIRRPQELRIGTHRVPIQLSRQIQTETAEWILRQGEALPQIHNYIHPTNAGFASSAQPFKLSDGSFIEIGDSQATSVRKARNLLTRCGFGNLKLEILLDDGSVITA